MTRLEKKCFIGSLGGHLLLWGIVFATAAFRDRPQPSEEIQILTVIPPNILDRAGVGGGNPNAVLPPVQPQKPIQPVQPQPQPPEPQVVQQPQPAPEPPKPVVQSKPEPTPEREPARKPPINPLPIPAQTKTPVKNTTSNPSPTKHTIKVDLDQTVYKKQIKAQQAEAARNQENESKQRANAIARALKGMASAISTKTAKATVFDVPGQGGGEAFADYRTVVYNVYYSAWNAPDDVADDQAVTEARIVVARDGSIIQAEVTSRSGRSSLDKSVEAALRNVPRLPPFPSGASDTQRTFRIRFNLKAKQSFG
jgi:TonB family protein